jgi:peptidoglycan/xylan/chitin deacetylase (PgdA/CDA1 family)
MPDATGFYDPSRSLGARIARKVTLWRKAAPVVVRVDRPILSMTFDDFPRSAATTGAGIVEAVGGRAGFYACTSMLQDEGSAADMWRANDIADLLARGHEIGAHGHAHLDFSRTSAPQVREDIARNLAILSDLGVGRRVASFAYPFGETDMATKRLVAARFGTGRGIAAGINEGRVDRAQLRAAELTPEGWTHSRAAALIEQAARGQGWLILFTHDVREDPSPWGVTPATLRALMRQARDAGLRLLPPAEAARACGLPDPAVP